MAEPSVLFLCTGNASRSVIAGSALARRRPELTIITAGTLVIDGLPLSVRTRAALDAAGLEHGIHRSQQALACHLDPARLVVAMAPEHVLWVRRTHPDAAARTTTLIHLVRQLTEQSRPLDDWIATANLENRALAEDEEITDPGGGEVDGYILVAHQIVDLIDRAAPLF